jgi:flagellar motor switch protein FliM
MIKEGLIQFAQNITLTLKKNYEVQTGKVDSVAYNKATNNFGIQMIVSLFEYENTSSNAYVRNDTQQGNKYNGGPSCHPLICSI